MAQSVRLTLTPDLENALRILQKSTLGTLNTTELIKMAIGGFAQLKKTDMTPSEMDMVAARSFYDWTKENGALAIDNIAEPEKLKPYKPRPHVRTR